MSNDAPTSAAFVAYYRVSTDNRAEVARLCGFAGRAGRSSAPTARTAA